jgi:molybdopterin molybdotransferase
VKAAVEGVGTLVFWRMAIKPGRPVAMGVIDGAIFIGLPGNPVASYVTFAYVARAAILALSGAAMELPEPVQARAAFTYKKKPGRREYVRAHLRKAGDGSAEVVKFPREGAGLLSSLVDTDGLVELREHVVQVEHGQSVPFLAYSSLVG